MIYLLTRLHLFVNDMSLYLYTRKSIHVVMWVCGALVPAQCSVWPRCCWGNWVLWPAGGWTGVLPGGPVDTRNRDNTAVSTTNTHTFTLCLHFLKITGGIHLALHGGPHLLANLSVWGPLLYRARKGPCFLLREGKYNSVTLPHPFFFSFTLSQIICPLRCLLCGLLPYGTNRRRRYFFDCTHTGFLVQWQIVSLKTKTPGNSKSVGKQLFEEHHQDAHLLPGPEEREEGYIVNIDLWKDGGGWKALFKKKRKKTWHQT